MDADTIVALQVFEDRDFVLTLKELQTRLPDKFDLIWMTPAPSPSSSSASSALNTPLATPSPSAPSSPGPASSTSIPPHHSDSRVTLKTDEDLHKAIHSSRNHKVTLRCGV
ncbi:hypothetical protein BGZ65_004083 [Modicella reniformis]|uniref:Uncharacterized protein n=1 Tax=Modicella reniformis TaxID=1440133 RepID=A0A9P6IKY6_9FUNG|nr:hypothetical protein BGZ65_004083 [Modicella reniformis]